MTKFDVQAEEREERLAKGRRQAVNEALLRGLLTRTHAEAVNDFFLVLGCLETKKGTVAVRERKFREYTY